MEFDENIGFVARHYRKGAFSVKSGWRRLGVVQHSWWSPSRVAACIVVLIVLGATATIVHDRYFDADEPVELSAVETVVPRRSIVRAIDFDDAPLTDVISTIHDKYGVGIDNVPADAESYRLTLHYEGNVDDLVGTINDIFDIKMTVTE